MRVSPVPMTVARVLVLKQAARWRAPSQAHAPKLNEPIKCGKRSAAGGAFALNRLRIAPADSAAQLSVFEPFLIRFIIQLLAVRSCLMTSPPAALKTKPLVN